MGPVAFPLARAQRDLIVAAAARCQPREACGLVAQGLVWELENTAPGNHSFRVEADALGPVVSEAGGWDAVQAVWHSHPAPASSPFPSEADLADHPVGKVMIICAAGELYAYAAA